MAKHNQLETSPVTSAYLTTQVWVSYYFQKAKSSDTTAQYCVNISAPGAIEKGPLEVFESAAGSKLYQAKTYFKFSSTGTKKISASVSRMKTAPTDVGYCYSQSISISIVDAPEPEDWGDGLRKQLGSWARDAGGDRWSKVESFFKSFANAGRK